MKTRRLTTKARRHEGHEGREWNTKEVSAEIVRFSIQSWIGPYLYFGDISKKLKVGIGSLFDEHEAIAAAVVEAALKVHKTLGPGLLEKFYEVCLCHELKKLGIRVARQVRVPIIYDDIVFDEGFRIDLLLNDLVVVETKAVELINPVWHAQVLTQLKITGYRLGFLINFNVPLIKDGIKRIIL